MNLLQHLYPGDTLASFIVRVLAEITLVTVVAILVARTGVRKNPAMRHGVCICALLCVLIAPLTTLGLEKIGWTTFQISLEQERPKTLQSTVFPALLNTHSIPEPESPFWNVERARSTASLIILVWMVGTGFLIYRLSVGAKKVRRLRMSAHEIQHPKLEAVLQSLRTVDGMPRVPVRFSHRVNSPIVVGPRHTTVILPARLLDQLTEPQLRCVLAHEFTHVRQRDPLIGLIQRLVEASYWPHPLVHVLNRDLVRAREEVCDNAALHGTTAPQYADTLLTVALGITPKRAVPGAIGLMTRPWRLEERVKGLLDPHRRLTTTMNTRHLALLGITLALGTSLIGGARIVAAPYPPHPQDTLDIFTHYNSKTHAMTVTHKLKRQAKSQNNHGRATTYSVFAAPESAGKVMRIKVTQAAPMVLNVQVAPPTPSAPLAGSAHVSWEAPTAPIRAEIAAPSIAPAAPTAPAVRPVSPVPKGLASVAAAIASAPKSIDLNQTFVVTSNDGKTLTLVGRANGNAIVTSDSVSPQISTVTGVQLNVAPTKDNAYSTRSQSGTLFLKVAPKQDSKAGTSSKTETTFVRLTNPNQIQLNSTAPLLGGAIALTGTTGLKSGTTFTVTGDKLQTLTLASPNKDGHQENGQTQTITLDGNPMVLNLTSGQVSKVSNFSVSPLNVSTTFKSPQTVQVYAAPKAYNWSVTPSRLQQSYLYSRGPVKEKVTTVTIDGDHVKVVGDNIKVVYVHPKKAKKSVGALKRLSVRGN